MKNKILVALAGNPNSGKTSVFNSLTGARQHVGNYPGVTVEKKTGNRKAGNIEIEIVDLPGTYSLTANSVEEVVARDFIIDEKPDLVVDIVDATNIDRNLYLTTQLMELGTPLVIALNMSDTASKKGIEFDTVGLSKLLGAPIVRTVGHKGGGMDDLVETIIKTASGGNGYKKRKIDLGREIEKEIAILEKSISENGRGAVPAGKNPRWLAVKLLENDRDVREEMGAGSVQKAADDSVRRLEKILGDHPEFTIAERRYGFIAGAVRESVKSTVETRRSSSEKLDSIMTHRVAGLPIFLGLMYLVFHLTFTLGGPPMDWLDSGFSALSSGVQAAWPEESAPAVRSLLIDGVIGGVGGVLIFLPNILLLFLAIAILEDSGYMARAAFIMDRLMHKIGLHGKSFIPLLIGFGCSVPAIMATRTLENRRDRLTTMLVAPLMSCGARLPIYALIIPAFFPSMWYAPMLWLIYMIGILLAIVSARLLRSTLFKGETAPFVLELPPYRVPTPRGVLVHMWERGWLYIKKAGTIILGISIILWAMTSYPEKTSFDRDYDSETTIATQISDSDPEGYAQKIEEIENAKNNELLSWSVAGRLGHMMEPLLAPMGFDWKIGTALIGSFAAKEVFVAQMGIVYSVGEADEKSDALRDRLRENYDPLIAFCIMLFSLISAPCMATIAVTKRESNSWKWAMFQLGGLTALAFVVTTAVYQAGRLIQFLL